MAFSASRIGVQRSRAVIQRSHPPIRRSRAVILMIYRPISPSRAVGVGNFAGILRLEGFILAPESASKGSKPVIQPLFWLRIPV